LLWNVCAYHVWALKCRTCLCVQIKLGLVVDLTNTSRFYRHEDIDQYDCKYVKLQCRGWDYSCIVHTLIKMFLRNCCVFQYTLWGIKMHPFYWYNNCTKLCHTMIILRSTREYSITYLFDILCKIENWEPAYQVWNGVWLWLAIHQSVIDQAIDQWRVCLMHVSKPKESIENTCYDVLFDNCQYFFYKTYITVFCFISLNQ